MNDQIDSDIQGFDDKPVRKARRGGKGWLIFGGVLVVIVGGISLAAPRILDQAKYKSLIQQKVTDATGYTVDWTGDIGLAVLPLPSVHLNNLVLSNGSMKILTIKEADVRVALMPLLSKKIDITSVELNEPDVTLTVDKQGNSTWMSRKLTEQAEGKDKPADAPVETTSAASPEIALNELKITNGRLLFKNEQNGSSQLVENLNSTLRAESLTGPYAAKGDLAYDKKNIEYDLKAGKIDGNQKSYPVNGKISLPDLKVDGEYAGVIASDPLNVDGELTIAADDLGKTIEAFTGSAPDLPQELDGAMQLKSNVLYTGEEARLSSMRLALGDIAYKGSIGVKNLSSDAPPLTIDLTPEKGDSKSSSALVATLSNLSVKGTGSYKNNRITISNGNIALRDQQIAVNGTYTLAAAGKRPVIDMTVKANRINVDELTGTLAAVGNETASGKGAASSAKPSANGIKGTSLPFDGNLTADIGSLVTGGKTYSPLKADIVSKGNALTINSLTVGTVASTTLTAKGRVGNLAALSDFDLSGSVQTGDTEDLMASFGMAPPKLDRKIGAATLNGSAKGSLENLAFNGTVNALKFAVTGQGTVATPMTDPVINSLKLNVKHPSFTEAVGMFQPGFTAPPSFRGPLDMLSTVSWNKTQYTLADIKGSLGGTGVNGNLNIAMNDKPSVSGALNFGDLVFDAAKSGSSGGGSTGAGASGSPAASSGGRWSSAPINTAWMKSFDADLTIKAKSITQDMWKLNNANLAFVLNNGALSINDLSAGMFGGNVAINGQVKSGASDTAPVSLTMAMNATDLNAQQLQSALTSKVSDTVLGTISTFKVNIASNGASPNALVNALSGDGVMKGKDIIVNGIDVAQLAETAKGSFKPLERAGSLFGTFKNGQTQFDTFDAAFGISNGVVNFTQLVFDGARAKIDGKGTVNLPQWTINLVNTITVKGTDIPPFDVTVKGPLDNPAQAGGNIIEGYLRDKAQKKVQKLIGNELEKRFGIPLGGAEPTPDATAPAAGTPDPTGMTAPAPAPAQTTTPEEEAVKALQGLFKKR